MLLPGRAYALTVLSDVRSSAAEVAGEVIAGGALTLLGSLPEPQALTASLGDLGVAFSGPMNAWKVGVLVTGHGSLVDAVGQEHVRADAAVVLPVAFFDGAFLSARELHA